MIDYMKNLIKEVKYMKTKIMKTQMMAAQVSGGSGFLASVNAFAFAGPIAPAIVEWGVNTRFILYCTSLKLVSKLVSVLICEWLRPTDCAV